MLSLSPGLPLLRANMDLTLRIKRCNTQMREIPYLSNCVPPTKVKGRPEFQLASKLYICQIWCRLRMGEVLTCTYMGFNNWDDKYNQVVPLISIFKYQVNIFFFLNKMLVKMKVSKKMAINWVILIRKSQVFQRVAHFLKLYWQDNKRRVIHWMICSQR